MSKLVDGLIPEKQECPFRAKCDTAQEGKCHHQGKSHRRPFSCASARAFDLLEGMGVKIQKGEQHG